jgi:hypothetical protein
MDVNWLLSFQNRQGEKTASNAPYTKPVGNAGTNLIKFNLTFVQLELAAVILLFFPQVDATNNVCWFAMKMRCVKNTHLQNAF